MKHARFDAEHGAADAAAQCGALCYRVTKSGKLKILMITSRDSGRWLIPKGWPIKRRSMRKVAAQEAFEEAGVKGRIARKPVGSFRYVKGLGGGRNVLCEVEVYPMKVKRLERRFPERGQRERRWVSAKKAMKLASDPELVPLIRRLKDKVATAGAARDAD